MAHTCPFLGLRATRQPHTTLRPAAPRHGCLQVSPMELSSQERCSAAAQTCSAASRVAARAQKSQQQQQPLHSTGRKACCTCAAVAGSVKHAQVVASQKNRGAKAQFQQRQMVGGQKQVPPTPAVDYNQSELVIFANCEQANQWFPVNILKGGQQMDSVVMQLQTGWGKALYQKFLIKQVAGSLYKDKAALESEIKRQPQFKNASKFEYAFKIRDKTKPADWYTVDNLTVLPKESELEPNVGDQIGAYFQSLRATFQR